MFHGEIYLPRVAQGMMIRVGRSISMPDIEAQLARRASALRQCVGPTLP